MRNISRFFLFDFFSTWKILNLDFFNSSLLRKYIPVSLLHLQRLVDTGRVNTNEPIDLTTLCNTKIVRIEANKREFGIQLTDEVFIQLNF